MTVISLDFCEIIILRSNLVKTGHTFSCARQTVNISIYGTVNRDRTNSKMYDTNEYNSFGFEKITLSPGVTDVQLIQSIVKLFLNLYPNYK